MIGHPNKKTEIAILYIDETFTYDIYEFNAMMWIIEYTFKKNNQEHKNINYK